MRMKAVLINYVSLFEHRIIHDIDGANTCIFQGSLDSQTYMNQWSKITQTSLSIHIPKHVFFKRQQSNCKNSQDEKTGKQVISREGPKRLLEGWSTSPKKTVWENWSCSAWESLQGDLRAPSSTWRA